MKERQLDDGMGEGGGGGGGAISHDGEKVWSTLNHSIISVVDSKKQDHFRIKQHYFLSQKREEKHLHIQRIFINIHRI